MSACEEHTYLMLLKILNSGQSSVAVLSADERAMPAYLKAKGHTITCYNTSMTVTDI